MDFSQQSLTPSYSQEDVREILDIAMADRSTLQLELSHPQLLEIAQELNISPEVIELAKNQWLSQQQVIKNIKISICIVDQNCKTDLINMRL